MIVVTLTYTKPCDSSPGGPLNIRKTPLLLWLVCLLLASTAAAVEVPRPEETLGHPVGADRKLASYETILSYLEQVAAASDRVSIEEAGSSTLGNRMPVVILSSAANQQQLERYREIARSLAHPRGLSAEQKGALIDEGKTIALATCTIHSTEVGCTQMVAEFVHEFATTQDPERLAWMDEMILLLMPSINPDGQVMVVDWYNEWLGTEFEGGRMPWLYQTYVGHDNNRDFYMLTQKETQVVNDLLYHRWFPQVFIDEHQMGSSGPRMFVPPQTDPLAPEVHSLIFRQADLLGTNMGRRLEEAGKPGVGNNMIFDSYWPGGTRNTAWWKNVTGLLTEVASARLATPIYIDPGELRGGAKGFPEYTRRANYPTPWRGGWWRLRDIVEYELVTTWAFVESCAENRRDILRNVATMADESIRVGQSEKPYAFVIPPRQHDVVAAGKLVSLLLQHGVEVHEAVEPLKLGYSVYPAGTTVVRADQAYRPFLLTMLRPQRYPEVKPYTDGPIIPPYDVTSWSLPIGMGVDVVEATEPLKGSLRRITEPNWPDSRIDTAAAGHLASHATDTVFTAMNRLLAAGHPVEWLAGNGDVWIPASATPALEELLSGLHLPLEPRATTPTDPRLKVGAARVGLYKPWVASMDEGWTRWLLEQYEFPFVNLANAEIRSGAFEKSVDVLLLPDVDAAIIREGRPGKDGSGKRRPWTPLPPRYAGGIDSAPETPAAGKKGKEEPNGSRRIKSWVENGGTLVALDSSSTYAIELFELPVQNVLKGVKRDAFDCPGSMLRLQIDTTHPLGFGMRAEEAGYFSRSPAFRTRIPDARFDRRVVARYPEDAEDVLISGYLKGAEKLERRAAVVEFNVGKGRVILIGFRAQHRAQPLRTFKLLFNSLYRLDAPTPRRR